MRMIRIGDPFWENPFLKPRFTRMSLAQTITMLIEHLC
jgi:hypothetical protein